MIKEIAFTAYPSKDVAALRKWYEENLGLTFSGPYEEDGVEKYNEANVGSGYFSILRHEWMTAIREARRASCSRLTISTKRSPNLRAKGVEAEDPYATPVCKITSFSDAEGNKVSLHQVTVPH